MNSILIHVVGDETSVAYAMSGGLECQQITTEDFVVRKEKIKGGFRAGAWLAKILVWLLKSTAVLVIWIAVVGAGVYFMEEMSSWMGVRYKEVPWWAQAAHKSMYALFGMAMVWFKNNPWINFEPFNRRA